ncbi:MAG: oxidoreductase [Peptococcaceae bacterium]|nr:MAG: oxidoreductase [Peptococcaceae bacterium]
MKKVLLKGKQVVVEDVPAPAPGEKEVLVAAAYSLLSSGTERAMLQESAAGLAGRVMGNPRLFRMGWQMLREQGIKQVWRTVQEQAAMPVPLGYSMAGRVVAAGRLVSDLVPGEEVACGGARYAHHAELVAVPRNLVARVPAGVDLQAAAFTTLGAIAMHGLRRAGLQFGETVVITGLGLLGLLAVQMAKAAGCRVVALDTDKERVALAAGLGADLSLPANGAGVAGEVYRFTRGLGADAVVICAATASHEPVNQAFDLCRQRGKVVGVGVFGMHFDRERMYRKEVEFLMSTSYGPGRYDPYYEEEGIDYPAGYVRWTENRNFQEFLWLLASGKVRTGLLVSAVFPLEKAGEAYDLLADGRKLPGILLEYPSFNKGEFVPAVLPRELDSEKLAPGLTAVRGKIRVAVVGAGSFVGRTHLPNLASLPDHFHLRSVVTVRGEKAAFLAQKYGAGYASADYREVLDDPVVDLVLIGTRHNLHYPMIMQALERGKAVFCEKPLCLTAAELADIREKVENTGLPVFTGFNRRHAPLAVKLKEVLAFLPRPYFIHYRVNAGFVPADHWSQDLATGGGRIIGETCHFFDLFLFLVERPVVKIQVNAIPVDGRAVIARDNIAVQVQFADGSLANLLYTSLGHRALPKERLEVFAAGKSLVLDDYHTLEMYGLNVEGKGKIRLRKPEKGWREELVALAGYLGGRQDGTQVMRQGFMAMEITLAVNDLILGDKLPPILGETY